MNPIALPASDLDDTRYIAVVSLRFINNGCRSSALAPSSERPQHCFCPSAGALFSCLLKVRWIFSKF